MFLTGNRSYQPKTVSGGIDAINQQCLRYYYYISVASPTILTVIKQEKQNANETIDSVTGSPYNGWIERKIPFSSNELGYKVRYIYMLENLFHSYTLLNNL